MAIPLLDKDFGKLFDRFGHSAFRLETLDHYSVPDEADEYRRFISGEWLPKSTGEEWCQLVGENVQLGRVMERVRVISNPLTSYMKFEIDWRYVYSSAAGERISLLEKSKIPKGLSGIDDYWLFDESVVIWMRYGTNGHFLRAEKETDLEVISRCQQTRTSLLSMATPMRQYLVETRTA